MDFYNFAHFSFLDALVVFAFPCPVLLLLYNELFNIQQHMFSITSEFRDCSKTFHRFIKREISIDWDELPILIFGGLRD